MVVLPVRMDLVVRHINNHQIVLLVQQVHVSHMLLHLLLQTCVLLVIIVQLYHQLTIKILALQVITVLSAQVQCMQILALWVRTHSGVQHILPRVLVSHVAQVLVLRQPLYHQMQINALLDITVRLLLQICNKQLAQRVTTAHWLQVLRQHIHVL